MTTRTLFDSLGNRMTYTDYTVKNETTLHQIAREHLFEEFRFNEIKWWKPEDANQVQDIKHPLFTGQLLLIPPVSTWVLKLPQDSADILFRNNVSTIGNRVRKEPVFIDNISNVIYEAPINTEFHYKRKKGSLVLDQNKRLWIRLESYKDKAGIAHYSVGWICVKDLDGKYYTNPAIDIPNI